MRLWLLALAIPQALHASELLYTDKAASIFKAEKVISVVIEHGQAVTLQVMAKTFQCRIPVSTLEAALAIQTQLLTQSSWVQCYGNLLKIAKVDRLTIETEKYSLGTRLEAIAK